MRVSATATERPMRIEPLFWPLRLSHEGTRFPLPWISKSGDRPISAKNRRPIRYLSMVQVFGNDVVDPRVRKQKLASTMEALLAVGFPQGLAKTVAELLLCHQTCPG